MPDLLSVATWICSSCVEWSRKVTGSKGDVYTVRFGRLYGRDRDRVCAIHGYTCTCKGFEFRGTCRHIREVKAERCAWNEVMEPTATCDHDGEGRPCCPDCGGPLVGVSVGV